MGDQPSPVVRLSNQRLRYVSSLTYRQAPAGDQMRGITGHDIGGHPRGDKLIRLQLNCDRLAGWRRGEMV